MGRMLGAVDTRYCQETIEFWYTATLVTSYIYVCPSPMTIVDIRGKTQVAGTGGACTVQLFKCSDTVAPASGSLIMSGSFNLVGTIYTNQLITLAPSSSGVLNLNPGDAIALVLTGTPTSAVGIICVTMEPT